MAYAISGAQSDIINFHAQKVARKHILSISAQGQGIKQNTIVIDED